MYQAIARNVRLSWLLLGLFVLLILVMGYVFGQIVKQGYVGIAVALVVAAGGALASYYYSDRIVLAISGAREVSPDEYPFLHNTVEGLATHEMSHIQHYDVRLSTLVVVLVGLVALVSDWFVQLARHINLGDIDGDSDSPIAALWLVLAF